MTKLHRFNTQTDYKMVNHVSISYLQKRSTRYPESVHDISNLPPLGKSDHVVLRLSLRMTVPEFPVNQQPQRRYSAINYRILFEAANAYDWRSFFNFTTVEEFRLNFEAIINYLIVSSVPLKSVHRNKPKPWVTKAVRKERTLRNIAWRQYRIIHSEVDFAFYKRQLNRASHVARQVLFHFELRLPTNARTNPKETFCAFSIQ